MNFQAIPGIIHYMKTYELTYIVSPEITSEEAEAKAKEIESAILLREGTILKQSNPIARTLSYAIKGKGSGFMGVLEFQLEPDKFVELEEIVQKDGKIVRHMVIIKKPARIRKERVRKPVDDILEKTEPIKTEQPKEASEKMPEVKNKVELKDIEKELDELLE